MRYPLNSFIKPDHNGFTEQQLTAFSMPIGNNLGYKKIQYKFSALDVIMLGGKMYCFCQDYERYPNLAQISKKLLLNKVVTENNAILGWSILEFFLISFKARSFIH